MTTDRIEKDQLIAQVAQRTGQDQALVEQVIEGTLDEIYQMMKQGTRVSLRNFGTFYVRPGDDTWTFKFNPSQKWRALFGWSSSYKGPL